MSEIEILTEDLKQVTSTKNKRIYFISIWSLIISSLIIIGIITQIKIPYSITASIENIGNSHIIRPNNLKDIFLLDEGINYKIIILGEFDEPIYEGAHYLILSENDVQIKKENNNNYQKISSKTEVKMKYKAQIHNLKFSLLEKVIIKQNTKF